MKSIDHVSPRERQVWGLITRGNMNRDIAWALGIAETTVKNHRASLMRKLQVRNLSDLTREAIRHGIITVKLKR